MTIVPVSFADILGAPNARSLFEEYAAECSIPEIGPINPQADLYALLERNGAMQCFAAMADEVMVGFCNVLASVVPHYGRKVATIESIFVAKDHRASEAGVALMAAIEQYARAMECAGILYSAPAGGQFEKLLERQKDKYRRTNAVFYWSAS